MGALGDDTAPSFLTYLGDRASAIWTMYGGLSGTAAREARRSLAGIQKWNIPCNWKFGAENFLGDTYHNVSHRSVDLTGISPSARAGIKGRRDFPELEITRTGISG